MRRPFIGKWDEEILFAAVIVRTTIDLHQAAGTYNLFTATGQDVLVEILSIRLPNIDVSDDVNITSISVQTNDATPQEIITSTEGAKANLTAENQIKSLAARRYCILKAGQKIELTIAGGAADEETICDVTAIYRIVERGGYLAEAISSSSASASPSASVSGSPTTSPSASVSSSPSTSVSGSPSGSPSASVSSSPSASVSASPSASPSVSPSASAS